MADPGFVFWSDGRLGNQLFQYAFCHGMAQRRGCRFDFVVRRPDFADIFVLGSPRERLRATGRIAAALKRLWRRLLPTVQIATWDPPAISIERCRDLRSFEGFFQSEAYFRHCERDIHRMFAFLPKHRSSFVGLLDRLGLPENGARLVAIHVRRGDYLDWGSEDLGGNDLSLPVSWYERATASLAGEDIAQAVIVTDDRQWCAANLRLPWPTVISNGNAAEDLQMLAHARVRVLSNSSFAWWGGWLTPAPGMVVVAPRYWLGFKVGKEYPPEIIPPNWRQV